MMSKTSFNNSPISIVHANKSQSRVIHPQLLKNPEAASQMYINKLKTKEAQPLNIDLKIDMDVQVMNQRFGIGGKDKYGDILVDTH